MRSISGNSVVNRRVESSAPLTGRGGCPRQGSVRRLPVSIESRGKKEGFGTGLALIVTGLLLALMAACGSDDPVQPVPPEPDPSDTTGHEYIWCVDTLGGWLSRVNDVFCVSENDAWAVGHFYVYDSTGKADWKRTANAAHWDGRKWTLVRINPDFQGGFSFGEVHAVHCFGSNNVWAGSFHWTGWAWEVYNFTPIGRAGGTYKIWGDRADNVYFVGGNGSIIHWNGVNHTQIGPDAVLKLQDIWGCNGVIYVAATDPDDWSFPGGYLIRIENGQITGTEDPDHEEQTSIWGTGTTWFSGGGGYLNRKNEGKWSRVLKPESWITGIRGTALNDVCILTEEGEVIHYNGSTFATVWLEDPLGCFMQNIAVSGRMVLAAGHLNQYAIVKRGYRQSIQ